MTYSASRIALSLDDVQALLTDPRPQSRADVARKVAIGLDQSPLSEAERKLALDILRAMAKDAESRVRQAIAETMKSSDALPHDVAMALAKDEESAVSAPVLRESRVLTDEDLISVLADGHGDKQIAIAGRADVSEAVSAAVVRTGNAAAVTTLVENTGARIDEAAFSEALDRYAEFETIKSGMVMRAALPSTIAERLVALVSDKLKLELVSRHPVSPETAADVLYAAREQATVGILPGANSDLPALVRQLRNKGRLTASLILRAICIGDIRFFEEAIAQLAGTSPAKASLLIHDAGPLGLKAIFQKANLSPVFFPAFRVAIDVYKDIELTAGPDARERFERQMIERILTQYQDMEVG
ncbi:MAG TPA: hypothetical protein DCL48_00685, partial [Alphaproteobacteria bacterium]|nr:hypothetical protein [Alphaproteobacteria bacterium]